MIKQIICNAIDGIIATRRFRFYKKQFKLYCKQLGIKDTKIAGEGDFVKKWSVFDRTVETYSYRLFSRYMKNKLDDIIPEDIGHTCIENVLNPPRYIAYYSDKNIFDELFRSGIMPKTFLRRIAGFGLLSSEYQFINLIGGVNSIISKDVNRVILKPSNDTNSGVGVSLFVRDGQNFVHSKSGKLLTEEYMMNMGNDFILQEAISQSSYLSRFNPTSINTLRIAVYRSVSDESLNVVSSVIRIGKHGEFVDNGHAGGRFVGINPLTGKLGKYACDQYGNMSDTWNDVNFATNDFVIPNWDKVLSFSKYIASKIHHCRLIALDVALDDNNEPRLIEFNICGFSFWLFMYSGQSPLGEFTNEIISYCSKRKPGICIDLRH